MLHITNGDCAAEVIRAAGVGGDVLPWRDVLHEGPVPARLSLGELSAVRARFIAGSGWGPGGEVERGFRERDETLRRHREHDEVVLWFEHDLYDQLQLAQLLDFFADHDPAPTRLTLVCGDEYLGMSTPERLAERFVRRVDVGDDLLALGEAAWNAFTAPDPHAVESLVAGGTAALPWMGPALMRHLEQFPSTRNGLSRTEQQALEAIAGGAATVGDAYQVAAQQREEATWLGDAPFADYLDELAAGEAPLIAFDDGGSDHARSEAGIPSIFARRVRLTDAGRAVLEGREDRVRLRGIDRWLGGVHLRGRAIPFRWSPDERRIVPHS